MEQKADSNPGEKEQFVAINFIECDAEYAARFEELFKSRAHAIDMLPGFKYMQVLKPTEPGGAYLVVSYWDKESSFHHWMTTEAYVIGHRRGFKDIADAKREGRASPMMSNFRTYNVLTD